MRFSIRDLLLVTVIVALAVGWAVDHRRQAASDVKAREKIEELETAAELGKKREQLAEAREAKLSDELWQRTNLPLPMQGRRAFPVELP